MLTENLLLTGCFTPKVALLELKRSSWLRARFLKEDDVLGGELASRVSPKERISYVCIIKYSLA